MTAPGTIGQRHRRARIGPPHRRFLVGRRRHRNSMGSEAAAALESRVTGEIPNAFMAELAEALGRCVIVIEV
ncbi:MAG: hypothetical protein M3461_22870 [Pseudomonadota bacterium]|nr:hypothetical protein [Pseudomonadota bacterium]